MDAIMAIIAVIASGLAWGAVAIFAYFIFFSPLSGSWSGNPTQVFIMASIIGFVLTVCAIINDSRR